MSVRAKFKVHTKNDTEGSGTTIYLMPVVGGSSENDQFYKYTPSGQIQLSTVNDTAAAEFEVGKEYYVDFTLAEVLAQTPVYQEESSEQEASAETSVVEEALEQEASSSGELDDADQHAASEATEAPAE